MLDRRIVSFLRECLVQGTSFVYAAPTDEKAEAAAATVFGEVQGLGFERDDNRIRGPMASGLFLSAARLPSGCACEHVNVLVLEESEKMERDVYRELLLIPAPYKNCNPVVIYI